MKKQILSIAATLTLLIPMAIFGFAGLTGRVSADVPFNFMVDGKELKAGKYTVSRISTINSLGALIIRSADSKQAANFNVNGVTDKEEAQPRLVFHRYGNQYFLAQIFDGEGNQGYGLMKSKAEREAAKRGDVISQNTAEPVVVTVVAQNGK